MASAKICFIVVAGVLASSDAFVPSQLSTLSANRLNPRLGVDQKFAYPIFSQRSTLIDSMAKRATAVSSFMMQASGSESFGVVITGGAGGVGFAYADEFLRLGHRVVICDISPKISTAAEVLQVLITPSCEFDQEP